MSLSAYRPGYSSTTDPMRKAFLPKRITEILLKWEDLALETIAFLAKMWNHKKYYILCYNSSILFFCFVFYSISNKKLTSLRRSLKIEIRICASRSTTPTHLARAPEKVCKTKDYK